ncbi:hypothetical protein [Stenotrophomonas sp. 24(2023)]|uniref:hypothetical protein n=1 Tax=Stenotrophomonas sp. 24(2023) TaxID=3068324 RepID=UPI0027E11A25|nr:hypothetical protein [Stenotrophomonas sp. 24(2023)]WMJ68085.1 hypothetical protein Q9R17_12845 [Stenotrophomonas sp. 24(2023)]
MTLPAGFHWVKPRPSAAGRGEAIAFEGICVVRLWHRPGPGGWMAQLDCHRPGGGPERLRPCTGHVQGRCGAEAWVWRHHQRLVTEVQQARRLRDSLRLPGQVRAVNAPVAVVRR